MAKAAAKKASGRGSKTRGATRSVKTRSAGNRHRAARKAVAAKRPAAAGKGTAAKRTIARKAGRRKSAARAVASRDARSPKPKTSKLSEAAALVKGTAAAVVAAIADWLPSASAVDDPIALLESDHRRFEKLLASGEETTRRAAKRRSEVLTSLAAELNVHETLEEKLLYPALRPHAEANEIVLEGYEEHHVADLVLKELQNLPTADEQWGPKFKVFKESIEHHIQEEEGKMFRIARAVLDNETRGNLAARMRALRAELQS